MYCLLMSFICHCVFLSLNFPAGVIILSLSQGCVNKMPTVQLLQCLFFSLPAYYNCNFDIQNLIFLCPSFQILCFFNNKKWDCSTTALFIYLESNVPLSQFSDSMNHKHHFWRIMLISDRSVWRCKSSNHHSSLTD